MAERRSDDEITFEVISGPEGPCLAVMDGGSGHRIAGPKPWGGGTTLHTFKVSRKDLLGQIAPPRPQPRPLVEGGKTHG